MSTTTTAVEAEVLAEAIDHTRGLAAKCTAGTALHSFLVSTLWEFEDMAAKGKQ